MNASTQIITYFFKNIERYLVVPFRITDFALLEIENRVQVYEY